MKKYLFSILFLSLIFLSTNAFGLSIKWDLSAAGINGTDDHITSLFTDIHLNGASLIEQNDTDGSGDLSIGDMFNEELIFRVNDFTPGMGDREGLNDNGGYEVTGHFYNVVGEITNMTPLASNPGFAIEYDLLSADLDMYIDQPPVFPQDPYDEITLANGITPSSVDTTNYIDGTKIASASLVNGAGNTWVDPSGSNVYDQGSTNIDLLFDRDEFLDGFWLDEDGVDLKDYESFYYFLGFPAVDLDQTMVSANGPNGDLYDAVQANDGSSDFAAIPEPGTMLLFGFGLLGLTGISRKYFQKKS